MENAFIENKSSYKSSICLDIKSKLQSESSLKVQIDNTGRNDIINYIKEQIQNARIMLN